MFNHRKFHAFSLYWSSTWYLLWCFFDGVTELPIYNHRETHYRLWMTVISNAHLLAHTENHMNNCWSGLAGGQKKKGWEAGEKEREKRKEGEERRKIGEWEGREKRGGRMEKKLFSANLTRTKTMTCPPTQTLHTKSPLPYIKIKYRFKKILTYFESEIRTLHLQEDLLTETQTKYLP